MMHSRFIAALLLALPVAVAAQTTPAPKQVTEVTEDLDPATGKVIRRTTRTYDAPAAPAPAARSSAPTVAGSRSDGPADSPANDLPNAKATDAQLTAFFGRKTATASLTATTLPLVYAAFIDKVRDDRRAWRPADWNMAAAVLNALNGRYDQLRTSLSLDDKISIRSQQAEFQALRTSRQLTDQVSDKL